MKYDIYSLSLSLAANVTEHFTTLWVGILCENDENKTIPWWISRLNGGKLKQKPWNYHCQILATNCKCCLLFVPNKLGLPSLNKCLIPCVFVCFCVVIFSLSVCAFFLYFVSLANVCNFNLYSRFMSVILIFLFNTYFFLFNRKIITQLFTTEFTG